LSEIRIPLSIPDIGEEEVEAVSRVLRRRWLTMGEETGAFEDEFARFIEVEHAVALSNCTVALHLALLALGLREGDEVIVPSLSFVATANAVRYCRAAPVFADIRSEDDPNLDPADVAGRLSPRTKGIVAVHYAGYAADMAALRHVAESRGLFLVEDAAQAAGAAGPGFRCGAAGDAACFSFYSTKNATTGEGGMLTTSNGRLAERVRLLRSHGMTATVVERDRGEKFGYDVVDLGYNYRIDEMRAAIGRVQLRRLRENNLRRRHLTARYHDALAGVDGVDLPFRGARGESAHHLLPVLLPVGVDREGVAAAMRKRGVQSSVHYRPIHLMRYYRGAQGTGEGLLPRTEAYAARELTLPLFGTMTEQQVDEVVAALRSSLENA
jgi:dTDP-4-amino-4,6-dideoxygalactose transaminase